MRDTRENTNLNSVIDNIEMVSDFYQRTTMTYKVGTQTPLFEVLVNNNILQPEPEEPVVEVEEPTAATEACTELTAADDGEKQDEAKGEAKDDAKDEVKEEVEEAKEEAKEEEGQAATTE